MNNFKIGDVVECIDATSTLLYMRKEYTVNKVEHGDSLGNDCIGFKGIAKFYNVNRFKLIRRDDKKCTDAMLEPELMTGDVVECVDSFGPTGVICGSTYTVGVSKGEYITVEGHQGMEFCTSRFKLIRRGYKDYSNVTSERTQKLYMVYCEDLPWGKYPTLEIARTEAERLARKHPCRKMFILETVECFLCSVGVLENLYLEEL